MTKSISEVIERTQNFLKDLMNRDDDKTYLASTHGCALRALLVFLYIDHIDFWHGHFPYNCCLNIIEAEKGVARLIADDKIYYDQNLAIDRYRQ